MPIRSVRNTMDRDGVEQLVVKAVAKGLLAPPTIPRSDPPHFAVPRRGAGHETSTACEGPSPQLAHRPSVTTYLFADHRRGTARAVSADDVDIERIYHPGISHVEDRPSRRRRGSNDSRSHA
jgi:hypothetical protein